MLFFKKNKVNKGEETGSEMGWYGHLYEDHIEKIVQSGITREEAIRISVGGDFDAYGKIERDLLLGLGLRKGNSIIDLGCGAGRLAQFLPKVLGVQGSYLGLDVHVDLLNNAKKLIPDFHKTNFRFELVDEPHLPMGDNQVDFVCAFSVVTHIETEETYAYLCEIRRVLKKGGKGVISYLSAEIEDHWRIFLGEVNTHVEVRHQQVRNVVMVPGSLNYLAIKAGLIVEKDIPATEPWICLSEPLSLTEKVYKNQDHIHLGQSCLVVTH